MAVPEGHPGHDGVRKTHRTEKLGKAKHVLTCGSLSSQHVLSTGGARCYWCCPAVSIQGDTASVNRRGLPRVQSELGGRELSWRPTDASHALRGHPEVIATLHSVPVAV